MIILIWNVIVLANTKDQSPEELGKIYSEQDLLSLPNDYDNLIANELLSRKSLNNKTVNFKGYVGYIGKNNKVHYNEKLEQKKFNIKRSK